MSNERERVREKIEKLILNTNDYCKLDKTCPDDCECNTCLADEILSLPEIIIKRRNLGTGGEQGVT